MKLTNDELLGIWTLCQMAIDEFPDHVAEEDLVTVKKISNYLDEQYDLNYKQTHEESHIFFPLKGN